MPTKTPTVTEILTSYRDGTLPREKMLAAIRSFPWKKVKPGNAWSDTAWENEDFPQPGTVEEVYVAEARGLISVGDANAIYEAIRNRESARSK